MIIYQMLSSIKNFFYDQRIFKSLNLQVPVVSVGNLSFGGTGKTPFIEFLAQELFQNQKIVIVCRSYKARLKKAQKVDLTCSDAADLYGDEACLLQKKLPHCSVWSGPRKYETAQAACLADQPQVILLDDGFSHRQLKRKFDLVLIDSSKKLKEFHRESFKSLKRADAVVLTKVNLSDEKSVQQILQKLQLDQKAYFSESHFQLDLKSNSAVYVFCGLAQPDFFKKSLELQGHQVLFFEKFKDHQDYSEALQKNIFENFKNEFKKNSKLKLVTTAKDAVKINDPDLKNHIFIADYKIKMKPDDQQRLFEKIRSAL